MSDFSEMFEKLVKMRDSAVTSFPPARPTATVIDGLRADVARRDRMIYRLAELADNWVYNNPDWVKALANCTKPDDPAYLAEAVKAALSLLEAEDETNA